MRTRCCSVSCCLRVSPSCPSSQSSYRVVDQCRMPPSLLPCSLAFRTICRRSPSWAVPLLFLSRRTRDTRHATCDMRHALTASAIGRYTCRRSAGIMLATSQCTGISESLSDLLINYSCTCLSVSKRRYGNRTPRIIREPQLPSYNVNLVATPDWLGPGPRRTDPLPHNETKRKVHFASTQRDNLQRVGRSKGNEKQQSAEQVEMLRGSCKKNDVEALSQSVFLL
jgi:hypothetical protein